MAGRRGVEGRNREDLYAAAEEVNQMLSQLKGGHRGRRDAGPPRQAQWMSDLPPQQEMEERPRNPEGPFRRGSGRGGPGPRRQLRIPNPLDPPLEVSEHPWGPRDQQQDWEYRDQQQDWEYRDQQQEQEYRYYRDWEYRDQQQEQEYRGYRDWEYRDQQQEQEYRDQQQEQEYRGYDWEYRDQQQEQEYRGYDWEYRDQQQEQEYRGHHQNQGYREQQQNWKYRGQQQDRGYRNQQQDRGNYRQQPPREADDPVTAQQLVMLLTQIHSFSISLTNLEEDHNLPSEQVKNLVGCNSHMFKLKEEVVSFTPRLKLCRAYSGPNGCQNIKVCDSLHMCPKYVFGWCKERENCTLGHRWHAAHNLAILKRLSMERVKYPQLRELMQRNRGQGQYGPKQKTGPLEVCQAYNSDGCDKLQCPKLHVCLNFVVGLTKCARDNCQLNHNLLNPDCCHLLRAHDLQVNASQRDVAVSLLLANPGLKDKVGTGPSAKHRPTKPAIHKKAKKGDKDKDAKQLLQQPGSRKKRASARERSEEQSSSTSEESSSTSDTKSETDDSDSEDKKSYKLKESHTSRTKTARHSKCGKHGSVKSVSHDSESSTTEINAQKQLPKQQQDSNTSKGPGVQDIPKPKPTPRCTMWAHYLYGDVVVPQICYNSVEAMCQNEESGCPKLHAINHFHWQVREQDGQWMNLRTDQVTCLERAFCDPGIKSVSLPRLDPSKLEASVSGLFLLLGRDIWLADFSTSTLTNSTQNRKLQLRRLCTEPVAGQAIKASTFHWYFQDINKKWVKYGDVDTAGNLQLVSSITSADIESHYLKTPQQPLSFQNSRFTFVLDLISMQQTNKETKMSRAVQRRPEEHLPKEKNNDEITSALPAHWDAMQPKDRSQIVTLGPASEEYKEVVALLGPKVPAANVVKVDRIQCQYHWNTLQNKIKEMTALYQNEALVNVQRLFHGTSHSVVDKICDENFDWRFHGLSSGQSFGRGVYFAKNADLAYSYCVPDSHGLKYMFVAKVAVGLVTKGDSSMRMPPYNPNTNMRYNSTVDDPTNPLRIVKYSEKEYCPEYLLTIW